MTIPLQSGRGWRRLGAADLPDEGRTNLGFYVLDEDDEDERAWFKYVNPRRPLQSSMYSFGVERVASVLAQSIDLPVPDVHLEDVDGNPGLVSRLVPGNPWEHVSDETIRRVTWGDREMWTTYVAFDVLVANIDRHEGNIHVEWNPPLRRVPRDGDQAALWLIDYGWSGLWPAYKFGEGLRLQDLAANAELTGDWKHTIRNNMPPKLRNGIALRATPERAAALENVRKITDDQIDDALQDVPEEYLTDAMKDITREFLCGRLARIDNLLDTVFPM